METFPVEATDLSLSDLAARAERGETVVLTRDGRPVADVVPHSRKGGLDFEGGGKFLESHGVTSFFPSIPADFDEPLPEVGP